VKAVEQASRGSLVGDAALYLGRTYQTLYETTKALAALRKAVTIAPDSIQPRLSYGSMLLDTGDVDEGIRQLRAAREREPGSSEAHSHMAHAFRLSEADDRAIEEAREAIRLDPSNA
jgi:tetratricopeptide (TPR) repeat protein